MGVNLPLAADMSGDDVLKLQCYLRIAGCEREGNISLVETSGFFGPATELAVKWFQSHASLGPMPFQDALDAAA